MILLILIAYLALILWAAFYWRLNSRSVAKEVPDIKTSIILPVRNESIHIESIIHQVLAQNSDQFELIIINDHSDDDTLTILHKFSDNRINIINLAGDLAGKKAAITHGIQHAQNEWIITIDADINLGDNWLSTILLNLREDICLVGPVEISSALNTIEQLQQWDLLAMQGFTRFGIESNLFVMGNGANLAFQKSAFKKVNGYAGNEGVASGDDLFLLEKFHTDPAITVQYLTDPRAIAGTAPCPDVRSFIAQRIRWGSKMRAIRKNKIKVILALVYAANLVWLIGLVTLFFVWNDRFLVIILAKIFVDFWFLNRVGRFFQRQISVITFLKIYLLQTLYILIVGILGILKIPVEWKGRKI